MSMNSRLGAAYTGSDAANFFSLELGIADLSAEASYFKVVPFNARLVRAYSVTNGAVAAADVTVTLKNNAGTALTNGAITIATAASAAGDIDSCEPTANNVFTQGQKIEALVTGGGAGGTPRGDLTYIFERLGD